MKKKHIKFKILIIIIIAYILENCLSNSDVDKYKINLENKNLKEQINEANNIKDRSCWDLKTETKTEKFDYGYNSFIKVNTKENKIDENGHLNYFRNIEAAYGHFAYKHLFSYGFIQYDNNPIKFSSAEIFKSKFIDKEDLLCKPKIGNVISESFITLKVSMTEIYHDHDETFWNNFYKDGYLDYINYNIFHWHYNFIKSKWERHLESIPHGKYYSYEFDKNQNITKKIEYDITNKSNLITTTTSSSFGKNNEIISYEKVIQNSKNKNITQENGTYEYLPNWNLYKITIEEINSKNKKVTNTIYEYNNNNLLIKKTYGVGDYTSYEYNENGLLVKEISFKNNLISSSKINDYDYDKNLSTTSYFNSNGNLLYNYTFTYQKR